MRLNSLLIIMTHEEWMENVKRVERLNKWNRMKNRLMFWR